MAVYLISEQYLKEQSNVNVNTLGYTIKTAIKTAQDISLRYYIGDALVDKLCMLVSTYNDEHTSFLIDDPEYSNYKELLTKYVQDFMVFQTMSEIIIPLRIKMVEAGAAMNTDNNYSQISEAEAKWTKNYYADRAEAFAKRLLDYLNANNSLFPEWKTSCGCNSGNNGANSAWRCGISL